MTIIEFFDKTSIENVASALFCRPEKVILIGDNRKQMNKAIERYRRVLDEKHIDTELSSRTVNKNDLHEIVQTLSALVEEEGNLTFDLTGGEDLYLVAVGIIMNQYGERVQYQRFNFRNETISDSDADGYKSKAEIFDISVEDNIDIYGGEIVTDAEKEVFTYPWDFNEDFEQDIDAMWEVCRKNPRLWNAHIGTIGAICNTFEMPDALSVSYNKDVAAEELQQNGIRYFFVNWIMFELQRLGLIRRLIIQDTVFFVFKNEQVKRALTVSGQVLELYVAKMMRSLKDKDGTPLYHDVKVGVVIGWDESDTEDIYQTINEIDVIAMKGAVPVFISCKNGYFNVDELYKLNTVATRFGNKYAKKVLICTKLDKLGESAEYMRARMDDMSIRYIDNVDKMDDADFSRCLKSLWNT